MFGTIYKRLIPRDEMNFATIIGLTAAFLTTFSMLPQVIKVVKTKHTKDLALGTYLILVIGILFWLVYGIMVKDLPVIIGNGVGLLLVFTVLTYKLKYK